MRKASTIGTMLVAALAALVAPSASAGPENCRVAMTFADVVASMSPPRLCTRRRAIAALQSHIELCMISASGRSDAQSLPACVRRSVKWTRPLDPKLCVP